MKFRKKPVVIEAHQWFRNGNHPDDLEPGESPNFMEGRIVRYFRHPKINGTTLCHDCGALMRRHGWINTLEGGHRVCPGDWIIRGIADELYPCKPEIFNATYEPVEEEQ